jgi:hypothetical protein
LSCSETMNSIPFMTSEILRLFMGFLIAAFHRQISDWVMKQEQVLVVAFRQRGIPAPMISNDTARNVYFGLGIFIMLLEMARIWGITHPESVFFLFLGR